MTTSTWCYKYVTELADASVIDGYADGSFKPDNTITYGAALKLVMLAAGYPEIAPTNKNSHSHSKSLTSSPQQVHRNVLMMH